VTMVPRIAAAARSKTAEEGPVLCATGSGVGDMGEAGLAWSVSMSASWLGQGICAPSPSVRAQIGPVDRALLRGPFF